MDSVWISMITTILGGALAISGGLLSQLIINKKQVLVENKVRTANKLEEAGSLANKIFKAGYICRAVIEQYKLCLSNNLKKFDAHDIIEQYIEKIDYDYFLLLIRLYEPSLMDEANKLREAQSKIVDYTIIQLGKLIENEWSIDSLEEFLKESELMYSELDSCYYTFMNSLQQTFSSYRLP